MNRAPGSSARDGVGRTPVLAMALLLLAGWSGWFLAQGSARIGGSRYPCVADDALITMAYARNATTGVGLDWSRRGDRVEGFTDPLWLGLLLAPLALPLSRAALAWSGPLLGLLSIACLLALVDAFARRHLGLRASGGRALALALGGGSYALAYWGLQGFETALQAAFVVGLTDLALRQERGEERQLGLGVAGGLAGLLRPDLLLAWSAPQAVLAARGRLGRASKAAIGVVALALPLLGWQLFRMAYFDAALPNTYALKLSGVALGVRLASGLASAVPFLLAHAPLAALAWIGARRLSPGGRALVFAQCAVLAAYSVWVGGDSWDRLLPLTANRFQVVLVPLLGVLSAAGLLELAAGAAARGRRISRAGPVVGAGALLALLISNAGPMPTGWRDAAARALVVDPPPQCQASMHVLERWRAFQRRVPEARTVATVWAGTPAFYSESVGLYDELGFNDRTIARQSPRVALSLADWRRYVPGHVKWDRELFLERYRPDAFFQVASGWGSDAEERLRASGYRPRAGFWVRADLAAREAPPAASEAGAADPSPSASRGSGSSRSGP